MGKKYKENIAEDYTGDFTDFMTVPTLHGKRMGLFKRMRFVHWRLANTKFLSEFIGRKFDVNAEYVVTKNELLHPNSGSKITNAHEDYILCNGNCYGGNVGDTVTFRLFVSGDAKQPEVRIRKLQMICKDEQGNISFEIQYGGFDYDNSLDDFFKDFVDGPYYSMEKK